MENLNCWEVRQCGRERGGSKVNELGVCPVSEAEAYHGVNVGLNAGRFCWAVTATLCGSRTQGTLADKASACMACAFYLRVVREQGPNLIVNPSQLLT